MRTLSRPWPLSRQGFSVAEIVIVVVVLTILAAVIIPSFQARMAQEKKIAALVDKAKIVVKTSDGVKEANVQDFISVVQKKLGWSGQVIEGIYVPEIAHPQDDGRVYMMYYGHSLEVRVTMTQADFDTAADYFDFQVFKKDELERFLQKAK